MKFDIKDFYTIKPLSETEFEYVESEIYSFLYDERSSYDLFKVWHQFFVKNNFDLELIRKYYDTYWKWYVTVTWYNFSAHSEEILAKIMPFQFMMAYRLDFKVPTLYANHVVASIPEETVQDTLHASIGEKIKSSTLPFDYHSGPSLSSLVRNIKNLESLDEFERSKLYGDMENFLFEENSESFSSEEKLEKIETLFEFFNFITDPKSITEFRQLYIKTAPYLTSSLIDSFLTDQSTTSEEVGEQDSSVSGEVKEEKITLPSLRKIKDIIVDKLEKITEDRDEFVLNELQKYSDESGDSRILDLYYYDEQSEKFVWNDELLRSS